jgi:Na+/melibiose symporter-like transporter
MRRIFTTAPVTSVYLLSTAAFWFIMAVLPDPRLNVVLFYIFGLPSYIGSLVAALLSTSWGWTPVWWLPIALAVGTDLILFLPMRCSRRASIDGER